MNDNANLIIDRKTVAIEGERNLLELARKAGIDIPTFCYHSELSVYGACRLCLVDVEGMGVVTSCSTAPAAGMVVRTNTAQIREMRKVALELILASHDQACPTCPKSTTCRLQELSRRMGVDEVRFKPTHQRRPVDRTSPALVRDPNKCILCGDCVRACGELQSVGAIDFTHRGAGVEVLPAFGKDLAEVECVGCGLCAAVCPTGALTPADELDDVWQAIEDEGKTVVAQIAPAVRVALGEQFGQDAGAVSTGKIVGALKAMGFDQVFDTCFAADLTVIEEAEEFLTRKLAGGTLPLMTSCCPAWVRFAELYFPDLLDNLSTCRSPQQMFGAIAKTYLAEQMGIAREDLVVVSIMPCTAKKMEARREEFAAAGNPDVDLVLTTQELGRMIEQAGLDFARIAPESLDMPMGFKTGAGVIFGASGGVTEAVLRYAAEKVGGATLTNIEFQEVRGEQQLRQAQLTLGGETVRLAVVYGLRQARELAERIQDGTCEVDLVEVMACPGGCIGGAGQPVGGDIEQRRQRAKGLLDVDKMLQLHKSQDNHKVAELYEKYLGEVGGPRAHELLHTHYRHRRRLTEAGLSLGVAGDDQPRVECSVCVGTNCYVKGSQELLRQLARYVEDHNLSGQVDVRATFCLERCGQGPNVAVDGEVLTGCTLESVLQALHARLPAVKS